MRKQIAAIGVAVLLVFAGCSAGGDGGGTTAAPETTGTAPGDTTTATDTEPVYDSPLDAATVAENHESAIRDAGTFTLVSTSNQTQGDQSFGVTSSIAADLETGEYFSRQNANSRIVETYGFGNGTAYQRLELSENETRYVVPQQSTNTSQLATGNIRSFVNAFAFDHVGTESVDDTSTHVYEASGFEDLNQSASGFGDLSEENVTSIDARVYVTDDGLVKQFEYSVSVSTENGEATVGVQQRYTDVGSTTVEQPSWLDEARENTSE